MRRPLLLVLVCLALAGCSSDSTSKAERGVCATFAELEASNRGPRIQELRGQLVSEAKKSGNEALERAAKAFDQASTKGDLTEATSAVGDLRDECDRLGLGPKS